MTEKYFCKKCNSYHRINSDIGKRHQGIKVKKPPRKTFELTYPDGTVFKTTSIYNLKYAVIHFNTIDKKWRNHMYVKKERALDSIKTIKEMHADGYWLEYTKVKLIELDQKK